MSSTRQTASRSSSNRDRRATRRGHRACAAASPAISFNRRCILIDRLAQLRLLKLFKRLPHGPTTDNQLACQRIVATPKRGAR